jgi:cytochrome c-type biogenesis protein CcmF
MIDLGRLSLNIALVHSFYLVIVSAYAGVKGREDLMKSARNGVHVTMALLTLASFALFYALIKRDFSLEYTAAYNSRDLPLFYAATAFWAGQKGSLLLWAWFLSLFSSIVLIRKRNENRELMPFVVAVLMTALAFFLILLTFASDPFERLPIPVLDGRGLNPLLQNPGMIIHPPTLYLGYVGFVIPFAYAMAALITGKLGDSWIKATRRWTLFSWYFLGMGILLGANWAYVELGWGGYWAWDPVENASLMPWLTGTAFLHSVMIQEKKDMLKVWNMVLIILTFSLSIFGTFITRSGVISSVHSFGQSPIGYFFLVFLAGVLVFSLSLLFRRLPALKSKDELDSFLSRESTFLYNNLLFVGIAFATFWGTVFPLISEAVKGVKVSVGPPFFNQVNVPIGLALIFITGICPLIAWRRATARNLKRNFTTPLAVGLVGAIALVIIGVHKPAALISFTFSIFVVTTIVMEFYRGTSARREMVGESTFRAFVNLVWRNKRRYGGYLVHVGIVMVFVGITGSSAYKYEKEAVLEKGQSVEVKNYRVTYRSMEFMRKENVEVSAAVLMVQKKGAEPFEMRPEKRFYYSAPDQPTTEVAINKTLKEDFYTILAAYESGGKKATFKFFINPLVSWIWAGGLVLTIGTIIAMLPDKKEKHRIQAVLSMERREDSVRR